VGVETIVWIGYFILKILAISWPTTDKFRSPQLLNITEIRYVSETVSPGKVKFGGHLGTAVRTRYATGWPKIFIEIDLIPIFRMGDRNVLS
jgi:hypothetical protein